MTRTKSNFLVECGLHLSQRVAELAATKYTTGAEMLATDKTIKEHIARFKGLKDVQALLEMLIKYHKIGVVPEPHETEESYGDRLMKLVVHPKNVSRWRDIVLSGDVIAVPEQVSGEFVQLFGSLSRRPKDAPVTERDCHIVWGNIVLFPAGKWTATGDFIVVPDGKKISPLTCEVSKWRPVQGLPKPATPVNYRQLAAVASHHLIHVALLTCRLLLLNCDAAETKEIGAAVERLLLAASLLSKIATTPDFVPKNPPRDFVEGHWLSANSAVRTVYHRRKGQDENRFNLIFQAAEAAEPVLLQLWSIKPT